MELAEDARLHLARGILSYLKHELSQPLGAILLTTTREGHSAWA